MNAARFGGAIAAQADTLLADSQDLQRLKTVPSARQSQW